MYYIRDTIYKNIALDDIEIEIIKLPIFQRLRNVHQLGLAHLVFPSANYNRFSHSIGVCHVMGRMMESLNSHQKKIKGNPIRDKQIRIYRLAALLHDIGHLPFSHASEYVYRTLGINHEKIRHLIFENDLELISLLNKHSKHFMPLIIKLFYKSESKLISNILSSDLDADRIDYLLRDSYYTGLPYGNIDIEELISQLRIYDKKKLLRKFYYTLKGKTSAEHLLLCRYYNYIQLAYDHQVVSFTEIFKDMINQLICDNKIVPSENEIINMITTKKWNSFDDTSIMELIKEYENDTRENVQRKALSIIYRRDPPRLIVDVEDILEISQGRQHYASYKENILSRLDQWCTDFAIPRDYWIIWDNEHKLTKIRGYVQISKIKPFEEEIKAEKEESVLILDSISDSLIPIIDDNSSILHLLCDKALFMLRIYILFPTLEHKKREEEISETILKDLNNIPWRKNIY